MKSLIKEELYNISGGTKCECTCVLSIITTIDFSGPRTTKNVNIGSVNGADECSKKCKEKHSNTINSVCT